MEHLDYDNYSQQRTDSYQQQMQQAKTEKKAYDKAMAKHRRIKQNVQTTLRNTHDSTQGRLLAKKDESSPLTRKNATTALPKT